MAKLQTELLFDVNYLNKIITQRANTSEIIIEDYLAGVVIASPEPKVSATVVMPLVISKNIYVMLEGDVDADVVFHCNENGAGISNPILLPVPFGPNGDAVVEFRNNASTGFNIVYNVNNEGEVDLLKNTWYQFEFNEIA